MDVLAGRGGIELTLKVNQEKKIIMRQIKKIKANFKIEKTIQE